MPTDGTNFKACADGACQVLVSGTVTIAVRSARLRIAATSEQVTIEDTSGNKLRVGGTGRLITSSGGDQITCTIEGYTTKGAVLTFTSTP